MENKIILDILNKFGVNQDSSLSQKEIDNIKNHPLLINLNLTDSEVLKNIIYLNKVIENDEKCNSSNTKKCPFNDYHLYAVRKNNIIYFYNDFCKRTLNEIKENEYKNLILYNYYSNSDDADNKLDKKFQEENANTLTKAKRKAIQLFLELAKTNSPLGIYIYGDFGVGKTYLTLLMANTFASAFKKEVAIVYMPQLVEDVKSKIDENSSESETYIDMLKNVDILFIDDLGAEYASEWFYSNYFLNIINDRVSRKKPTYFNSNMTFDEYEKKIMSKIRSFDSKITSGRIMQRIKTAVGDNIVVIKQK